MKRVTRWFATHAFGIGMVIGILEAPRTALPFHAPARYESVMSRLTEAPAEAPAEMAATQEDLRDYIAVQEEIRSALFPSAAEASGFYELDELPTSDADFTIGGRAFGDLRFQLDVVSAQEIESVSADPNWVASGGRVSFVVGTMRNIAGASIDIAGVVFNLKDDTSARRNFLFPTMTLGTQVTEHVPIRSLRFSTPASIVRGRPDGARRPGDDPSCLQSTTELEKCICEKQLLYDECIRNIKVNNAICVSLCLLGLAAALAVCALPATIPGIGWITSGGCALAALATAAVCVNGCTLYMLNGLINCREQFRIALIGCGIYW